MKLTISKQFQTFIEGVGFSLEYVLERAGIPNILWKEELELSPMEYCRFLSELADLHLNYEQVPASKEVVVDWHNMLPGIADADTPEKLYRVTQMRFGKNGKDKDKSTIEYNPYITLRNIPLRAYDYVVNGKSAIEWIMERYCDKVDKKSGIRNDANQWGIEHGNPKYPLELLQSIITLSLRTLDIIDKLSQITFD